MEDQKTRSKMLRREALEGQPGTAAITGSLEIRTTRDYNPTHEALLRYAGSAKAIGNITIRKSGMMTEAERAEKRGKLLIFAGRKLANN